MVHLLHLPPDLLRLLSLYSSTKTFYALARTSSRYASVLLVNKHQNIMKHRFTYERVSQEQENYVLTVTRYYPNGLANGIYEAVRMGVQNQGLLSSRCYYRNGQKHGLYESWWHDGKPLDRCLYYNGELNGPFQHFGTDGDLKYQAEYIDGKFHGTYECWTGAILRSRVQYTNGSCNGRREDYYVDTGRLCEISDWKDGKRHGNCFGWDESGILRYSLRFINDNIDGRSEYYNSDGTHRQITHYRNGLKHGSEETWDSTPSVIIYRIKYWCDECECSALYFKYRMWLEGCINTLSEYNG